MRSVTVRELKTNPSEALRDAREGPVLVLNRGVPEALIVSVADGLEAAELERRVGEASAAVRGLAEHRGARAVQAVDRATRAGESRRAADGPAPYRSPSEHALATLTATLQAIIAPQRISLAPPAEGGDTLHVVLDVDRDPGRGDLQRIEDAARAVGASIRVRSGSDAGATPDPDEAVIFDRAAVPMSIIDRLIAEGRATPPRIRDGSLPPPLKVSAGLSATEALLAERMDDPR